MIPVWLVAPALAATVEVVVPTRVIAPGQAIVAEDLAMKRVDAQLAKGAIGALDEVTGRVARVELLPGEPVRAPRLAPTGTAAGVQALVSSGLVTLDVKLPLATDLFPVGSAVDLVWRRTQGTCLLDDGVPVVGNAGADGAMGVGSVTGATVIAVAVPESLSPVLELVKAHGTVTPVLRPPGDAQATRGLPVCVSERQTLTLAPGRGVLLQPTRVTDERLVTGEAIGAEAASRPGWTFLTARAVGQGVFAQGTPDGGLVVYDVRVEEGGAAPTGALQIPVSGAGTFTLPQGGYIYMASSDPSVGEPQGLGQSHVAVVGKRAGVADVVVVYATGEPVIRTVTVGDAPWPTTEPVALRTRWKKVPLPLPPAAYVVADPSIAEARATTTSFMMRGVSSGRTALVTWRPGSDPEIRVIEVE